MEKILLAMDAMHINTQTIEFSCYLARMTGSRLTGVFMEDLLSEPAFGAYQQVAQMQAGGITDTETASTKAGITDANIQLFRHACETRGVVPNIHRDRGIPLDEVIQESRFADLVVVDAETSFTRKRRSLPGKFVKDVLQEAECPVIIAPYTFHAIDEIIFAYNGSASSVWAIKQFTYLFPELKQKKAMIVEVKGKNDGAIDEQYKMKEWLKHHYSNVEVKILTGDPSDELFGYLIDKKNAIVVIGAYGRGWLSRLMKPSQAHIIVKTVN
ncbi:MAG TPA: universal stress protein, partial [Puia sp.]|nr:universal stress protein [Puia sp.]